MLFRCYIVGEKFNKLPFEGSLIQQPKEIIEVFSLLTEIREQTEKNSKGEILKTLFGGKYG